MLRARELLCVREWRGRAQRLFACERRGRGRRRSRERARPLSKTPNRPLFNLARRAQTNRASARPPSIPTHALDSLRKPSTPRARAITRPNAPASRHAGVAGRRPGGAGAERVERAQQALLTFKSETSATSSHSAGLHSFSSLTKKDEGFENPTTRQRGPIGGGGGNGTTTAVAGERARESRRPGRRRVPTWPDFFFRWLGFQRPQRPEVTPI
jgi:hypothetical protein